MLITTVEAGKKLGISGRRVRQLVAEGRIKSIQIGGRWLIEDHELHYERKPRGGYRPRGK